MILRYILNFLITFAANKERRMDMKGFFGKFVSRYLLGHLLAMVIVVCLLIFGVIYGLSVYTHHGEGVEVPDLYGMNFEEAASLLGSQNVILETSDTGYNKRMDPNCILLQIPSAGVKVKGGRTIYVTINSTSSPKVRIPDIIENSSYREANARLTAIGFLLSEPKVIAGEKDWVYGIMSGSRNLRAGDMVSIETPLVLVIGSGEHEETDEDEMLAITDSTSNEPDDFIEIVGEEEP